MQIFYPGKDFTIVFYGLTGIVFQREEEGSCSPSARNTALYFTGKRSGKIVQGMQNIIPAP